MYCRNAACKNTRYIAVVGKETAVAGVNSVGVGVRHKLIGYRFDWHAVGSFTREEVIEGVALSYYHFGDFVVTVAAVAQHVAAGEQSSYVGIGRMAQSKPGVV